MSSVPEPSAQRLVEARATGRLSLAPPATETEVEAFERRHNITLPSDYRWFVLNVGNGGYGPPYYGIEPLSDRLVEANSALDTEQNHNSRLSEPFPAREADWTDWEPEDADREWAEHEAGRLLLGTDGCAILWVLVLSGDARGEVWRLGDDAVQRAARNVLDWYVAWLDERGGPRSDDPVPMALTSQSAGPLGGLIKWLRGSS